MANLEPYLLDEAEAEAAGRLIAAAFVPAPMMAFLFPDSERRAQLLPQFFTAMTRLAIRTGNAIGLGHPLQAASLWFPPDGEGPPEDASGDVEIPAFLALLNEGETARVGALSTQLEVMVQRSVTGPHWYLAYAAVAPAHQGRGLGTTLLRHTLDQLAPIALPCFLESADEKNLRFYERLGFQIADADLVPDSQLRVWVLRRASREVPTLR